MNNPIHDFFVTLAPTDSVRLDQARRDQKKILRFPNPGEWPQPHNADNPEHLDWLYQVLGAFATAQAPVTQEQICAAFHLRTARWDWAFRLLSQFLERSGVRQEEHGALTYRIYHETFREFLLQKLAAELSECHEHWGNHCLEWRKLKGYARLYALRYLPTHLIEASKES